MWLSIHTRASRGEHGPHLGRHSELTLGQVARERAPVRYPPPDRVVGRDDGEQGEEQLGREGGVQAAHLCSKPEKQEKKSHAEHGRT